MRTPKILNALLVVTASLIMVFFFVLFYSVRFEPDDMNTSLQLQRSSLIDLLINKYYNTSFRPLFIVTSFFTIGYISDTGQYLNTVFVYFLFVYALFAFSIYKILQEIFSVNEKDLQQKRALFCFSNLFFISIYFLTTEKIEIFGWYCASTIYLFPMAISSFAVWRLIKSNKNIFDYVLLFICAVLISGGAEHVPASLIAVAAPLTLILFFEKRGDKTFFREHKYQIRKTVFFVLAVMVFFFLFVTNPGLWSHYNDAQADVIKTGGQNQVRFLETLIMFCKPAKLMGFALLFISWNLFSQYFDLKSSKRINLIYFVGVFFATVLVAVLTGSFAYNSLVVGRVWFVADVSFFVLLSAIVLKYKLNINPPMKIVIAVAGLIIMLFFAGRHIPALLSFSAEHDRIVSYLQKQDSGKVIVIENFPKPDLINQVELSLDPNVGENQLFCQFYHIKAKVSVKK